jgi:Ca2+-binding RTX toxin-like protein
VIAVPGMEIAACRHYFVIPMMLGTRTSLVGLLVSALVLTLVLAPAASAKRIVGNMNANRLIGTPVRDDIFGRGGKDVIVGRGGHDRLYGEGGDDIVLGGPGNDRMVGEGRDDTLDGGPGADRIWAGRGTDVVEAGPGDDVVYANEDDVSMDSIDCGDGTDVAYVNRSDRVFNCERVVRARGSNVPGRIWIGSSGDDYWSDLEGRFRDFLVGLGGNDMLNGHAAPDMLWGTTATTPSRATMASTCCWAGRHRRAPR